MHVLLTGAAGFIGSHLAERLRARGDTVVGFDNFDQFYPRPVKDRNLAGLRGDRGFVLVEGDLRRAADLERALEQVGPVDVVVHLAALAGVRPSLDEPGRFWDVNVTGTLTLLEVLRGRRIGRVVFASSSSVYGADSEPPFRESDACARPLSPYAATKRAGELMAFGAHHLHGMDVTCLRLFTVYGPRQRPDLAIHKFTRLIAAGQPIELFGDGSTSRDYTWVDDIVDGIVAAVDQQVRAAAPGYRIYNLGGSRGTTLRELVDRIASALGRMPIISARPDQPGDMRQTLADVSLAGRELGYAPRVDLAAGIPRFVAWWQSENGPPGSSER
jgi:UDP-glucuronate 4-epimerase